MTSLSMGRPRSVMAFTMDARLPDVAPGASEYHVQRVRRRRRLLAQTCHPLLTPTSTRAAPRSTSSFSSSPASTMSRSASRRRHTGPSWRLTTGCGNVSLRLYGLFARCAALTRGSHLLARPLDMLQLPSELMCDLRDEQL